MLSTIEKVIFLKGVSLFEHIPPNDLIVIAQISHEENIPKGHPIFKENDTGDSLYLIVSGDVLIHKSEENLANIGSGGVFGDMAILDSEPRSASATTEDDSVLLKIEREDFSDLLHETPEISLGIIRVLCGRVREANDRMERANKRLEETNQKLEKENKN